MQNSEFRMQFRMRMQRSFAPVEPLPAFGIRIRIPIPHAAFRFRMPHAASAFCILHSEF